MPILYFILLWTPFYLVSNPLDSNILIYKELVEVNAEINANDTLLAGKAIVGSVLVTHDKNALIDVESFKIKNTFVKVKFIQTVLMSEDNNLILTIYQFNIPGMPTGIHNLGSLSVNVSGKSYSSSELIIEVP